MLGNELCNRKSSEPWHSKVYWSSGEKVRKFHIKECPGVMQVVSENNIPN